MTDKADESFTISVNDRRKVRVNYRRDGIHHTFSSPDVIGASFFSRDKNKAYEGFVKRLKELVG